MGRDGDAAKKVKRFTCRQEQREESWRLEEGPSTSSGLEVGGKKLLGTRS
jgi:hypothetical protein